MTLYFVLLITFIDIFTPVLIQNSIIPGQMRWISHGINLVLIFLLILKVAKNQIPFRWISLIFLLTIIGCSVALLNGQSIIATIWGWWLLFRYPIIGLVVASSPYGTSNTTRFIKRPLIVVIIFEVVFQVAQYLNGQVTGDDLAGTFGDHGTAKLLFVFLIAFALFLGEWITSKRIVNLIVIIILGMIASVLGEMKMFYFAVLAMGSLALVFYLRRQKIGSKIVVGIFAIGIILAIFPVFIDRYVYDQRLYTKPFFEQMTDMAYLQNYVSFVVIDHNGNYDVGRNYSVLYVWQDISKDSLRLLLGDGLGSRGQSNSLGSVGVQIQRGDLGLFTGSSLIVFIGELGILGLLGLIMFFVFTIRSCFRLIHFSPDQNIVAIAYGVIIFTFLWPVWLWYTSAWTLPGSMPLYWLLWGVSIRYSLPVMRMRLIFR